MKDFIGNYEGISGDDMPELHLGTPSELWLGVIGESAEERAARLDAGRDILADNPDLIDLVTRMVSEAIEADAVDLLTPPPSPCRTGGSIRTTRREVLA